MIWGYPRSLGHLPSNLFRSYGVEIYGWNALRTTRPGKHAKNYGKITLFHGKITIFTGKINLF